MTVARGFCWWSTVFSFRYTNLFPPNLKTLNSLSSDFLNHMVTRLRWIVNRGSDPCFGNNVNVSFAFGRHAFVFYLSKISLKLRYFNYRIVATAGIKYSNNNLWQYSCAVYKKKILDAWNLRDQYSTTLTPLLSFPLCHFINYGSLKLNAKHSQISLEIQNFHLFSRLGLLETLI